MARYSGQLLVPAEGFSLQPRFEQFHDSIFIRVKAASTETINNIEAQFGFLHGKCFRKRHVLHNFQGSI